MAIYKAHIIPSKGTKKITFTTKDTNASKAEVNEQAQHIANIMKHLDKSLNIKIRVEKLKA